MKRTLLISALLFLFFSASAQFKAGAGVSFQLDGSLLGVTGKAHYTINEDFAGQTSFTYYFEDITIWALDFDVHYAGFDLNVADFAISPLAGINILRWGSGIFNFSTTNFNIGVNATKDLGSVELFIEPKFSLGNGSSLNIAAGIYF